LEAKLLSVEHRRFIHDIHMYLFLLTLSELYRTAVNPSDENNTGATPGTIAGAVVGSIVGLLALLALPFLFLRWKRKGKSDAEEEDVEAARPFDIRTAQVTSHFPTSKVHPQPPTSDNDPSGQLPPSLSPLSPLRRDADPPAPVPAVNSPPPPVSPLLQSPNHPNSSQPMNLETALGVLVRSIDRQPSANQQHSNDFPPNHPSD